MGECREFWCVRKLGFCCRWSGMDVVEVVVLFGWMDGWLYGVLW